MKRNDFHRALQGIGGLLQMTLKGLDQLNGCLQEQRIALFLWLIECTHDNIFEIGDDTDNASI